MKEPLTDEKKDEKKPNQRLGFLSDFYKPSKLSN